MSESERTGILSEISNWLKLLGLIVLVAESVIIAAMTASPTNHPLYNWYPVFMLLFLVVIVVAIFLDRHYKRQSDEILTLAVGDKQITVNTSELKVPDTRADKTYKSNVYSDSQKGFIFESPISTGWSKPQHMDSGSMLIKLGLIPDAKAFEQARAGAAVVPMGQMLLGGSNIIIEYGQPTYCEITDNTSNSVIDTIVVRILKLIDEQGKEKPSEDDIIKIRKGLLFPNIQIKKFPLQNRFAIHVYDKDLAVQSPISPNLGNLFVLLTKQQGGAVDKLVANEDSILWGSQQTLTNIQIESSLRELTTYTINALFENDKFLFELNVAFSPQTEAPISVWDDLKNMISSFKVSSSS